MSNFLEHFYSSLYSLPILARVSIIPRLELATGCLKSKFQDACLKSAHFILSRFGPFPCSGS